MIDPRKSRALLHVCALLFVVWSGEAQTLNTAKPELPVKTKQELDREIMAVDRQFADEYHKEHTGGLTIEIVSGPELVWTKNYGFADIEKEKQATADTLYRIGSITKQFTALMLLQLLEHGKVHPSDPFEKFFPEVNRISGKYPGSPPIALIQLATHCAGLGEDPDDVGTFTTGPVSQWEQQLIAALPRVRFEQEPDAHFIYSNIGYAILGEALSRAAGQPYTDYVREHILAPLEMSHTRFEPDRQMMSVLAKGYVLHDGAVDSKQAPEELKNGRGYKVLNGALLTTISDMARFVSFEMGYGPEKVLSKKLLRESQSQMFWAEEDGANGYGLGLMFVRNGDTVGPGAWRFGSRLFGWGILRPFVARWNHFPPKRSGARL